MSVPFLWGARNNAALPEGMSLDEMPANIQTHQQSTEAAQQGNHHRKNNDADVASGCGSQTDACIPQTRQNTQQGGRNKQAYSGKADGEMPFGWGDRMNTVPPHARKEEAPDDTAVAVGDSKVGPAALPFGWGARTNTSEPVDNLQTGEQQGSSSGTGDAQQVGLDRTDEQIGRKSSTALPFGWGTRTNTSEPVGSLESTEETHRPGLPSGWAEQQKRSGVIPGLVVGTRIHFNDQSCEQVDRTKIIDFLQSSLQYASMTVIAVGASRKTVDLIAQVAKQVDATRVHVINVDPWGKFAPALNTLVSYASHGAYSMLCLQSLEVIASVKTIKGLCEHLDHKDTLVCGSAFLRDHSFSQGLQVLGGRTCPWNTLAVWNVAKLSLVGFPLIAEGRPSLPTGEAEVPAGVEEVCAISILQKLCPCTSRAKLILDAGATSSWATEFSDPARAAWHAKKMKSKCERPRLQLAALGIDPGIVEHIIISN